MLFISQGNFFPPVSGSQQLTLMQEKEKAKPAFAGKQDKERGRKTFSSLALEGDVGLSLVPKDLGYKKKS